MAVYRRRMWRQLPAAHRRWIIVNALIVTAIINVVSGGGIAWLSLAGERRVPLWSVPLVQRPSTIVDTVGTFFVLPLVTGLLASAAVSRDIRRGLLEPLAAPPVPRRLAQLPASRLRRAATLGVLCVLALGPLAIVVLVATGFDDLSRGQFVLYKALLCVVLGAVVTPLIAVRAMMDGARRSASPAPR
jgi:hypothetical protein